MDRKVIATKQAPAAVGPYSQAIRAGGLLFVSGQLGLDPATGVLVDGVEAQAERALDNVAAILEEAGLVCRVEPMWEGTPFANVLVRAQSALRQ